MRARALISGVLLTLASVFALSGVAGAAAQEKHISHTAKECIEKLEAGGEPNDCQEAPSPILPATDEIIFGGLAFVILFILMAKVAYPGIKKGMEDRAQRIRQNLDDAERVRAEAQGVLEDYQRQVGDAKAEAARIIDEARQTAEQLRRDLMARAEAEAAEVRTRSQDDVLAAQERAVADLRGQVATLAIDLAEKVVERNLDRDTNVALINSYIDQVGAQG
jgi:F-type H+-transporting ATPase subunit b